MKVIYSSGDLDGNLEYKLTYTDDARPLTEADGMRIDVDAFILYEDVDKRSGDMRTFVKIADCDGTVYTSGGAVVLRKFREAIDFLARKPGWRIGYVTPSSGTSKAGRHFHDVTISLAPDNAAPIPNAGSHADGE